MSNFLTNLLTRNLGSAPDLLKPKLPSLFEPPAGNEPILEASASVNTPQVVNEESSASTIIVDRRHVGERVATRQDHDVSPHAEASREISETNRAARRTILPLEPETQMQESIAPRNAVREAAKPIVSVVKNTGERRQVEGPRVEAAQPAEKVDESKANQRVETRLVPVVPKIESLAQTPRVEDSDAKVLPIEERAPTVHISIGRIDVRAVTQPSPPARTITPHRPKLTLDDYLQGRNEGKR